MRRSHLIVGVAIVLLAGACGDDKAVGGLGAISAGFDGYLYLDLEPGPYLAVDFMPDPGDPRPHMLDGYSALFTVEA